MLIKKINKKIFVVTGLIILMVIITTALVIWPVYTEPEKAIIKEYDGGVKLSPTRNTKVKGGWKTQKSFYEKIDIVMTKFSLTEPVYTIVSSYFSDIDHSNFQIVYLQRKGLFQFEVLDYVDGYTNEMYFEELKELASKESFLETFKEDQRLIYSKPPSRQELEKDKEESEIAKEQEELGFEKWEEFWLESTNNQTRLQIYDEVILPKVESDMLMFPKSTKEEVLELYKNLRRSLLDDSFEPGIEARNKFETEFTLIIASTLS